MTDNRWAAQQLGQTRSNTNRTWMLTNIDICILHFNRVVFYTIELNYGEVVVVHREREKRSAGYLNQSQSKSLSVDA